MHAEITIPAVGRVFRDAAPGEPDGFHAEISYTLYLDVDRVRRWIRKTASLNKTRESVSGPLKIFVKIVPPGTALQPSGAERKPGDPLTVDCTHDQGEDCINCRKCGKCDESVGENDLCSNCDPTPDRDGRA